MNTQLAAVAALILFVSPSAYAVPPSPGPIDVNVTNPTLPVAVVPSWTPPSDLVVISYDLQATGGAGGANAHALVPEDMILTDIYVHVDVPTSSTPSTETCRIEVGLVADCDQQGYCHQDIAKFGTVQTTPQKSASQTIRLPNVYVDKDMAFETYMYYPAYSSIFCSATVDFRGVKVPSN